MTKETTDILFKGIGALAVITCLSSSIPQILKMRKTQKTNDISMTSLVIMFFGLIFVEMYSG